MSAGTWIEDSVGAIDQDLLREPGHEDMTTFGASRNRICHPMLQEGLGKEQVVGLELLVDCIGKGFGSIGHGQFGFEFESSKGPGASMVHVFCPRGSAGLAKG